ncbi:MAG: hypothetical protein ACE5FO_05725 [Parvularculaceae bacterium]
MGLTFFIIATCIVFGVVAAVASFRPSFLPEIGASLVKAKHDLKRFSPRKTLFLIGPSANHPACRMQRRLLKPAIAALIRNDVTVVEVYGENTPRKNGEPIAWLDSSLLRHAMEAESGFFVIYVDDAGKTLFRSEAPMLTADILTRACLDITPPHRRAKPKSAILRRLRAA